MLVNFVDLHLYPKRHLWTLQCTLMNFSNLWVYLWPSFLRIAKVHPWTLNFNELQSNDFMRFTRNLLASVNFDKGPLSFAQLMKFSNFLHRWTMVNFHFLAFSMHFPKTFKLIQPPDGFSRDWHDFSGSSRLKSQKFIAKKCMDHSLKVSSLSEQN